MLQDTIAWVRSVATGEDTVGRFKPINSRRYLNNTHETILHFTRDGARNIDRLAVGASSKDKSHIARWDHAGDRRRAGNVWLIPHRTARPKAQRFDRPAGFPVEPPRRCIQLHGRAGGVGLDPSWALARALERRS